MAAMRTWEGQPGQTQRLYIVGGRRIWRTDVTWAGRETIGTQLGNQSAVRLDGVSMRVSGRLEPERGKKARTFSVWMSDDADRANRIRYGAGEAGEARAALDLAVDSGYLPARPPAWDALDRVLALTWPWVAP